MPSPGDALPTFGVIDRAKDVGNIPINPTNTSRKPTVSEVPGFSVGGATISRSGALNTGFPGPSRSQPVHGVGQRSVDPGPDLLGLVTDGMAAGRTSVGDLNVLYQQIYAAQSSRQKEAETIPVGQFPSAPQYLAWKRQLKQNVTASSGGFYDACFIRIGETENKSFDELGSNYPFETLDRKNFQLH